MSPPSTAGLYGRKDGRCVNCFTLARKTPLLGDNGHAPAHEVSHEHRKTIELALQPLVLHRHVLAPFEVAGFVEALAERGGKGRIGRFGIDESDDRNRSLLRPRDERPSRRRAAEQAFRLATAWPI